MIITAIEPLGKGRMRICLNDEPAFVVYKKEVDSLRLEEGAELTQDRYNEICETVLKKRCILRAMHILQKHDQTRKQLFDKLISGEYPEAIAHEAVAYVEGYHYVDDREYARRFITARIGEKSRRFLSMELFKRGVEQSLFEEVYEEVLVESGQSETEKLSALLEKKLKGTAVSDLSPEEKNKLIRHFLGKGFSYEEVRHALDITS